MSPKYVPSFATLALVQKEGGANKRDATSSLAITPSLPVPHNWVEHDLIVDWGWGPSIEGGEMLPMLEVGWRASAMRGKEAGCFRKVAGMSIIDVVGQHSR